MHFSGYCSLLSGARETHTTTTATPASLITSCWCQSSWSLEPSLDQPHSFAILSFHRPSNLPLATINNNRIFGNFHSERKRKLASRFLHSATTNGLSHAARATPIIIQCPLRAFFCFVWLCVLLHNSHRDLSWALTIMLIMLFIVFRLTARKLHSILAFFKRQSPLYRIRLLYG